jgi:hypothetical protein
MTLPEIIELVLFNVLFKMTIRMFLNNVPCLVERLASLNLFRMNFDTNFSTLPHTQESISKCFQSNYYYYYYYLF